MRYYRLRILRIVQSSNYIVQLVWKQLTGLHSNTLVSCKPRFESNLCAAAYLSAATTTMRKTEIWLTATAAAPKDTKCMLQCFLLQQQAQLQPKHCMILRVIMKLKAGNNSWRKLTLKNTARQLFGLSTSLIEREEMRQKHRQRQSLRAFTKLLLYFASILLCTPQNFAQ